MRTPFGKRSCSDCSSTTPGKRLFLRFEKKRRRFPIRGFMLLRESHASEQDWLDFLNVFRTLEWRMLGIWGRQLRRRYPTLRHLKSAQCRSHLLLLALLIFASIQKAENRHSRTQRSVALNRQGRSPALTKTSALSNFKLWIAELKIAPWLWTSDEARLGLEGLTDTPLPPYRYTVELMLVQPHAMDPDHPQNEPSVAAQPQHLLRLTPAELALITQLDYDIGRRIGDELDGISPTRPHSDGL